MSAVAGVVSDAPRVVGIQERRLGGTLLRTYRTKVDLDQIVPNERQPRTGSKVDEELQRQIEANEGLFEPLLVEPHPDQQGKLRIIDGERRWTNSRMLVQRGRDQYRQIPVEVVDRTLTEEERLRVWIYIHRQRKEWDAREKEMVAHRLVELAGRASAANILGVTMRELDKLVEIFELSQRFTKLRDPNAAITWARELTGVSKKLLTPSVIDAVVGKVNQQRITNSKELRKLRTVLRDPVAREHFLTEEGDIDSAALRISEASVGGQKKGLVGDLAVLSANIKKYAWTDLEALRGDRHTLSQLREAVALLERLEISLSHGRHDGKSPDEMK
jgi:ParB family transcriptional regulator, chromosome partitioning protein